jgi:hypothetical protein
VLLELFTDHGAGSLQAMLGGVLAKFFVANCRSVYRPSLAPLEYPPELFVPTAFNGFGECTVSIRNNHFLPG